MCQLRSSLLGTIILLASHFPHPKPDCNATRQVRTLNCFVDTTDTMGTTSSSLTSDERSYASFGTAATTTADRKNVLNMLHGGLHWVTHSTTKSIISETDPWDNFVMNFEA